MLLGASPLAALPLAAHTLANEVTLILATDVTVRVRPRRVLGVASILLEDIDNVRVRVEGGNPAVSASPNYLVRAD